MNIVLIGLPGSGKTTLGKETACALEMTFVDTDALIFKRTGKTPRDLYSQDFSSIERGVVATLAGIKNTVVATGGSTPLDLESRALLQQLGVVYFLDIDPKTCFERVMRKGVPAYLKGINLFEAFLQMAEKRRDAYLKTLNKTEKILY